MVLYKEMCFLFFSKIILNCSNDVDEQELCVK